MTSLLLLRLSWPEVRHHPWRNGAALVAVMLGVSLAFSVHLINASALAEFSAAVRAVDGQPDLQIVGPRAGFDEALYERVAQTPQVALASPVLEADTWAFDGAGQRVPIRIVGVDALVVASLAPALLPLPRAGAGRFAALEPEAIFLDAEAERRLAATPGEASVSIQSALGRKALRVEGRVATGGPPLGVMDIAGAQVALGMTGRLTRIDVRLVAGADRQVFVRELALPAGVRIASPGEAVERI